MKKLFSKIFACACALTLAATTVPTATALDADVIESTEATIEISRIEMTLEELQADDYTVTIEVYCYDAIYGTKDFSDVFLYFAPITAADGTALDPNNTTLADENNLDSDTYLSSGLTLSEDPQTAVDSDNFNLTVGDFSDRNGLIQVSGSSRTNKAILCDDWTDEPGHTTYFYFDVVFPDSTKAGDLYNLVWWDAKNAENNCAEITPDGVNSYANGEWRNGFIKITDPEPEPTIPEVYGQAYLEGAAGDYFYWGNSNASDNMDVKSAVINGNAQYEVAWDIIGNPITSFGHFVLRINGLDGDFTSNDYPDLNVTVDAIYIDGKVYEFTDNADAYNLTYYEGGGHSRVYLADSWGINGGNDLGLQTTATWQIKVIFTVSGLYSEGTSNVEDTNADVTMSLSMPTFDDNQLFFADDTTAFDIAQNNAVYLNVNYYAQSSVTPETYVADISDYFSVIINDGYLSVSEDYDYSVLSVGDDKLSPFDLYWLGREYSETTTFFLAIDNTEDTDFDALFAEIIEALPELSNSYNELQIMYNNLLDEPYTNVSYSIAARGDANLDYVVDTRDAALMAKYSSAKATLGPNDPDPTICEENDALAKEVSDVNGDGVIDTRDAACAAKYASMSANDPETDKGKKDYNIWSEIVGLE